MIAFPTDEILGDTFKAQHLPNTYIYPSKSTAQKTTICLSIPYLMNTDCFQFFSYCE
jgi:hypothetical protein